MSSKFNSLVSGVFLFLQCCKISNNLSIVIGFTHLLMSANAASSIWSWASLFLCVWFRCLNILKILSCLPCPACYKLLMYCLSRLLCLSFLTSVLAMAWQHLYSNLVWSLFKAKWFTYTCFLTSIIQALSFHRCRPWFPYLLCLILSAPNAACKITLLMLLHSWFTLLLVGFCCVNWLNKVWLKRCILSFWSMCTLKVCLEHWRSDSTSQEY